MGYFLDNVPRNGSFVLHDTRKRPKKEKKKGFTIFKIN